MAERRMFSRKVIESGRFLKMPPSTRLLYYDLGMRADDDGVVEAYTVMSATGATEDDLKVLHAKGLVQILNEDLVTFITDWTENNKLRPDRKLNSIYRELLLRINPDVVLVDQKPRADTGKVTGTADPEHEKTNGRPMDVQRTTAGRQMDRIGKDSIDRVKNPLSIVSPPCRSNEREDPVSVLDQPSGHAMPAVPLTTGQWQRLATIYGAEASDKAIRMLSDGITSGRLQPSTNTMARLQKMLQNGIEDPPLVVQQKDAPEATTEESSEPRKCPHCGKRLNEKLQCLDCGIEFLGDGIGNWEEQKIASPEEKARMAAKLSEFLAGKFTQKV